MKCKRCGRCCIAYDVMIVDDPKQGYRLSNFKYKPAGEECQHLVGDKPGEYSCGVHDKSWYKKTPCYDFTQIEHCNAECRIGVYTLQKYKEKQDGKG